MHFPLVHIGVETQSIYTNGKVHKIIADFAFWSARIRAGTIDVAAGYRMRRNSRYVTRTRANISAMVRYFCLGGVLIRLKRS